MSKDKEAKFWENALKEHPNDVDGHPIFKERKLISRKKWREERKKGLFSNKPSDQEYIDMKVSYFLGEHGIGGKEPFPFFSAFEPTKQKWVVFDKDDIDDRLERYGLHSFEFTEMTLDFVDSAIGVLEHENENPYVRLAAKDLRLAYENEVIDYHISIDPKRVLQQEMAVNKTYIDKMMPTDEATVYVPDSDRDGGNVVLPVNWIKTAVEKPIQALTRLIGSASHVRDDLNREWRGSNFVSSRYFSQVVSEVPNSNRCLIRSEALQAEVLHQAYKKDQRQYHKGLQVSADMYKLMERYPGGTNSYSWLFYPDPPEESLPRGPHPSPIPPEGDITWGRR